METVVADTSNVTNEPKVKGTCLHFFGYCLWRV